MVEHCWRLGSVLLAVMWLGTAAAMAQEAPAGGAVPVADEATAAATLPATLPVTLPMEQEKGAGRALIDKLVLGGWTVGVQLALSVAGLAFVVERLINLRRRQIAPAGLMPQVEHLWDQKQFGQMRQITEQDGSVLARMVRSVVDHRANAASDASTIAGDLASRELRRHLQKAYPIAVVATLEPLLGLFGTVWGMIGAFDKVAMMGEMGNASALSNEISLALVTTAVGLAVAIPMLAMYHFFKSRTATFGIELEEQVGELINRRLLKGSAPEQEPPQEQEEPAHAHQA